MNKEIRRGPQGRGIIERDIQDKIWKGDIPTLHLPARDMHAFYNLAVGEEYKDFVSRDMHMNPGSVKRSLGYLRETFEVESTEQAFGMLVARGFPLPDECMPMYEKTPKFSKIQLSELKQWVEGGSYTDIAHEKEKSNIAVSMNFQRARMRVNAASNIQLVAVALQEGFLQSERQEDGSFTFKVDRSPRKLMTDRQKKVLKMRFQRKGYKEIGEVVGVFSATIYDMAKAKALYDAATIPQLLFKSIASGQVDIDELTADFDFEKLKSINQLKLAMLAAAVADEGKSETSEQLWEHLGNELHYAAGSMHTYASRTVKELGVKTYLQAMIMYKAAVEKGIIFPFEEDKNGYKPFPQSAVIFTPTQQ